MHMAAGMLINMTYVKVKLLVFLLLLACCSDQATLQILVNWICKYSFPNFAPVWICANGLDELSSANHSITPLTFRCPCANSSLTDLSVSIASVLISWI